MHSDSFHPVVFLLNDFVPINTCMLCPDFQDETNKSCNERNVYKWPGIEAVMQSYYSHAAGRFSLVLQRDCQTFVMLGHDVSPRNQHASGQTGEDDWLLTIVADKTSPIT